MTIPARFVWASVGLFLAFGHSICLADISDSAFFKAVSGTEKTFTFQETEQDDPFGKVLQLPAEFTTVADTAYLTMHSPQIVIALSEPGVGSFENVSDALIMLIGNRNGGMRTLQFIFSSDPPEDGTFLLFLPVDFRFPEGKDPIDVTNALFGNGGAGQEHRIAQVTITSDFEMPEPSAAVLLGLGLALVGARSARQLLSGFLSRSSLTE
jgi:hypothetical protein